MLLNQHNMRSNLVQHPSGKINNLIWLSASLLNSFLFKSTRNNKYNKYTFAHGEYYISMICFMKFTETMSIFKKVLLFLEPILLEVIQWRLKNLPSFGGRVNFKTYVVT